MRIESVQIKNYKSYFDSSEILFTSGFNVIVGKNNSGKTALTEILSLDFSNNGHKSLKTKPNRRSVYPIESSAIIRYGISQADMFSSIKNTRSAFAIPVSRGMTSDIQYSEFLKILNQNEFISFQSIFKDGKKSNRYLIYPWETNTANGMLLDFDDEGELYISSYSANAGDASTASLAKRMNQELISRVYAFRAERFHVGQCKEGSRLKLLPDASNLPEVLRNLKSGHTAPFNELLRYFQMIFPEFKDINIVRSGSETIKIFLSQVSSSQRRTDLDIPLQDSGTGVGQILSILSVVITSNDPQIIIIDEPQSFLHPDAIRILFGILNKDFPQHQYIVTTHSPSAISSANPSNIIQLKKEDSETIISRVNKKDRKELKSVLLDLGARLSDVFGSDAILWVEGETEEICFREIVLEKCKSSLMGNTIIGVAQRGDFESKKQKNIDLVIEIYNKLSSASALLPPALGFLFDKENLTPEKIEDYGRRPNGKVHFISRKMYENYLLHPDAIAALISNLENFSEDEITAEMIQVWIEKRKNGSGEDWYKEVHAAKLLDELISELSKNKHTYEDNKIQYGFFLTRWLLENDSDHLNEIANILDDFLSSEPK